MTSFIDFDHREKILYDNIYFNDSKIVVKVPVYGKETNQKPIKMEEFDLSKYTYLLAYD